MAVHGRRRFATLLLAGLLALPAACAGGRGGAGDEMSPLTGLPTDPTAPVLAVKVDNSPAGRPWSGVEDADVVYVEPVEGGTTRLLAVFSSRQPETVGPVRSARESDVTVLAAYGRPALAYSGSAPELAGTLAGAPLATVTPEASPGAFRRDPGRRAPENLYASPAELLAAARGVTGPRDVGFRFGAAPAGGTPEARREIRFPAATVGLAWDDGRGRWTIEVGGAPAEAASGAPIGAATVVVQRVTTKASAIHDVAGAVSPYAVTVGQGAAEILRDGRAYPARWSRPTPTTPTSFVGPDGAPVPFATGPVWVLLLPRD